MSGPRPASRTTIDVVGADANNLRDVDAAFPLGQITVVTGVSGSGKSSLLADTLAAEGARRTRTFLGVSQEGIERDDVRAFVSALPPTVLVGQRRFRPSSRTTVGTATGFLAVLRRLYVLESSPYSERTGGEVPRPSAESYAGWIVRHYRGAAEVWAVPVRDRKTDGVAAVERLASHGAQKILVYSQTDPLRWRETGRDIDALTFKGQSPDVPRTIEGLIGEVRIGGPSHEGLLRELLERAFKAGNGSVVVMLPAADDPVLAGPFGPRLYSERHWVHPGDPAIYAGPSEHLLTFNASDPEGSGACPACGGTGEGRRLREEALVAHPDRSMRDGAFAIWTPKNYKYVNVQHETVEGLRGMHGFSPDVPWSELPTSARTLVLDGSDGEPVFDVEPSGRKLGGSRPFPGFRSVVLEKAAASTKTGTALAPYVEAGPCGVCGGTRWSSQARALRVGGRGIADLLGMTFTQVEEVADVDGDLARSVSTKARRLVEAARRHARSIVSVGLGYLTGDRGMLEVSEGESRRVRLARVLDAGASGACLLLDEPARGLHEADLPRMAAALGRLRGAHTVVLNEHRERLWDAADWLVEVGPGAGAAGGKVTYAGPPRKREVAVEQPLRSPQPPPKDGPKVTVRGASVHNVEDVDCTIPLGRLTCIAGVSGSGKSSFVRGVLTPALLKAVSDEAPDFTRLHGRWRSVSGAGSIREVVALDQAAPPANRRSLVATFLGVFDGVRETFAGASAAGQGGLSASDFGVNAGAGRCPVCLGVGEVEAHGLRSACPACGGARYGRKALSVRVAGVNVQELLDTPIERLGDHAAAFGVPDRLVDAVCGLGVGYVALGRRVDTLSGGEVQRLRLAKRLGAASAGPAFFVLDEPAAGLHALDIGRLAGALDRALDGGRNTVVIVEHDLRLVRSADWVVEFGPGSGPDGGQIVFAGPPDVLTEADTPTGLALAGNLPAGRQSPRASRPAPTGGGLSHRAREMGTKAFLNALVGGETTEEAEPEGDTYGPTVVVSDHFWSGRDGWEVADLDLEIPKLLLDVQRAPGCDPFAKLLALWDEAPDSWLAVHPFLAEIEVWGAVIPRSVVRSASSQVAREGFRLVTLSGGPATAPCDVREVRATGDRFVPEGGDAAARLRVLRDAFAVGAHYVELRAPTGELLAVATDRLIDLGTGVVGPMAPVPIHFTRHDPRGCCPACGGARTVATVSELLVIADRHTLPDGAGFLTSEADTVLKGVLRNEMKPFLKRLAAEGLWDPSTPFDRLSGDRREMILFGFWSRPGAGSFLKGPKDDPAVVASWLRWDGLYRHVLARVDRSTDAGWAGRVHESASTVLCPRCGGSGLQLFADLLGGGGLGTYGACSRSATAGLVLDLLNGLPVRTPRQRLARDRVLQCLSPLAGPGSSENLAAVVTRAVETFTTIEPVPPEGADEG